MPRIEADHPTPADQEYPDLLDPAIGTDLTEPVRKPRTPAITELRINVWRTQSSPQSWLLALDTTVDRPTAVTRPVVRQRPESSRSINAPGGPVAPPRLTKTAVPANDPNLAKPFRQISSNLSDG
ncbi:hypothetical protein [Nocardia sp. NPDC046763]|uniref:hypothetical protein n=1 Tax=Nocardia sp. NPDC046763 TaxID=3155256 RepID=UPI0033EC67F8